MWEINQVRALCTLPAADLNYKLELKRSSIEEIREAVGTMKKLGGKHKGRISACEMELKKREKDEQRKD